jgi:hypothetical protein
MAGQVVGRRLDDRIRGGQSSTDYSYACAGV